MTSLDTKINPSHEQTRRRNPYLFVVGCQRSGTTLLQRMLDHHPELAVGYDSQFIPRPIKRLAVGVDPPLTPRLVDRVVGFARFARLGLPEAAVRAAADRSETYAEFVCGVYEAFAQQHGKPFAGEKSPGYCRHLPHLNALFPWARIIHLVRDGRDVALSIMDWGKGAAKLELFEREPVAVCALWWRRDVLAGRDGAAGIDSGLTRVVRYETMVEDPVATMRDLAAFLGLPDAPEMAAFHEGKTRVKPGRSAKAAWLPPTQGLRDWRSQMSERDLALFDALAGDALDAFGYPRGVADCSSVAVEAEACRQWWREHVEATPLGDDDDETPATGRAARVAPSPTRTSRNPFVFIVGCPRSGTTLLKRMVDAHPDLAITPETHWIPRFFRKRVGVTPEGLATSELPERLLEYPKFANLRLEPEDVRALVPAGATMPYAEFVTRIFDGFGRRHGKSLVGDKTPGYVQSMPLLNEQWPQAKFVHLIRDGRDVCLSVLDWDRAHRTAGRYGTWERDRVSTAALWWERFVRLGREAGERLGPDLYHEVRYESLVTDPEAAMRSLCGFLGIPFDDAMVSFHVGKTKDDPTLSAKRAWRPVTAGIRDWRTDMASDDVVAFEAIVGDLLDELDLPRAAADIPSSRLEHAAAMRDAFKKDPHFKERSLPAHWTPRRS
ncbi:MAG: sulfotransferase [Phycisphaerales bacterium]|nr:sulfotransferase [Phycisphaerales bacterium]